ncbi:MAG: hypothetical protein O3C67_05775 [Cyanobacteria bacterium]|nr:hypothetical protein [Cyanobacteriota bacterium]
MPRRLEPQTPLLFPTGIAAAFFVGPDFEHNGEDGDRRRRLTP